MRLSKTPNGKKSPSDNRQAAAGRLSSPLLSRRPRRPLVLRQSFSRASDRRSVEERPLARSLAGEGKTVVCPCLFAPVLKQSDGRRTDNPRGGMKYLPHESVFFARDQPAKGCSAVNQRSRGARERKGCFPRPMSTPRRSELGHQN